ncbi:transcription elongation factor GreA [Patescibacteria group bacterium]|nr:transcription elongation factor GreA [Patescibacteria group bacterium]
MANYITKEGVEKLQKELQNLKEVRRREVSERLRAAAAQGDLSENFDYSDAKEEQEIIERRIAELEETLSRAEVVEEKKGTGTVQIGSQVTLETAGDTFTITITGSQEADPLQGKVSAESPLGTVLLGKNKGDTVEANTPGGKAAFKIGDIA